MSIFTKGDFKTREEWLKKQKKAGLKKQEEKYNKSIKPKAQNPPSQHPKKEKLNQIITLDTQQSTVFQRPSSKIETNATFKNEADAALYSSMHARLQDQQLLRDKQRSQIAELNRLIQQAKTESTILKAVNSEIPSFEKAEAVKAANKQLTAKCAEMQAYLNSHGAFYEGSAIVGEFNVDKVKKDIKDSKTNYRTPSAYQFTAIEQRVQELNENLLKEMGTKRIVNAQGVNKFKQCEKLQITFFKNGVNFEGVNFYQYSSKDGRKILEDLTDGYYPHVLKKAFPDGIYMALENKIGEVWGEDIETSPPRQAWFFGKGHSLDHD